MGHQTPHTAPTNGCAHCGQPITTVTLAGITVWTHAVRYGDTYCPYKAGVRGRRATPNTTHGTTPHPLDT